MRRAVLLPLGALCGALAYGAGYLLVARVAPPVGRGILKGAAELSGCAAMYSLTGKGRLYGHETHAR